MSGSSGFERAVKEVLEPYEVPYNSADWGKLERALDGQSDSGHVSRSGLYALLLGGSVAAFSSLFVLISPVVHPQGDALPTPVINIVDLPNPSSTIATNPLAELGRNELAASPITEESTDRSTSHASERPIPAPPTAQKSSTATIPAKVDPPSRTPSTDPSVRASITEGCPGTVIDFEAENLTPDGMYLWNFGDGSFSNKPRPQHAFAKSGSFEVMLSHSTPGGGNIRNKAAADRIVIHEAPEASFNVLKQEYENTIPSVHFENRSLSGGGYAWDFGDGGTSTVAHPDHVYKKAGVYTVSLTVTNAKGCQDRVERNVRIDADYDLMAPQTFSPNGDGVDDLFIPEALKTLGVKFNLSVFESGSGELVYETNDPQRPWNGRMNNRGALSAPGSYIWMVELKDGEKLGGSYNGSLQLVR